MPKDQWTTGNEVAGFAGSAEIYLKKYQNPAEVDSMMRLQNEVDETKIILHNTIEEVLQRDEKLQNLVEKSEDLSAASKTFYKTVPKSKCCGSIG